MTYVAPPPDIEQLFRDIDPGRLALVMQIVTADGSPQGYVHWDKLRHLQPPAGISSEEWWLVLRMGRALNGIPLTDDEGRHFAYATPSSALRLLHYVDQHCSGEIAMAEVVTTDEQARHHYLVSSLMEEAIRSSQLEGATTSRQIAKELLRTGRAPRDRSELMILNNYRALDFMRAGMGETLTPDLVMALQGILTEGTLDDPTAAGRLQTPDEERVVVLDVGDGTVLHTPPPAGQLPGRLQAMCDFANRRDDPADGFVHPVIRGILLHFWLAYDHPFADGNGRTARALFYWYMRTRGYWLIEYLSISKILYEAPGQYAKAYLLSETDENDATYFILHQLEVIRRAVGELHVYLERKVKEVRDVERSIHDAGELNHRQLALLSDAIRHPGNTYTYHAHAASHRVTHETARNDLMALHDRGLLQRRTVKRTHVFTPAPNLSKALPRP